MRAQTDSDIEALGAFLAVQLDNLVIDNNYNASVELYSNESWDSPAALGGRQIYYLYCTKYSWFKTSSALPEPLTNWFSLPIFVESCQAVFGSQFTESSIRNGNDRTNSEFGGFNPAVSNVYFTYGSHDPNRLLGLSQDLNVLSPVDIVPRNGKLFNILPISENDLPEVVAVKERARLLILQWWGGNPNKV